MKANCDQAICCQKSNGKARTKELGARKYGEYTCDLPLISAEKQLKWLKENLKGHDKPNLILWTGDSISHDMNQIELEDVY